MYKNKLSLFLASAAAAALVFTCLYPGRPDTVDASETSAPEGFSSSSTASSEDEFHTFDIGPGLDNLSPSDEYAAYQWGFKNYGDLRMIEIRKRFSDISQKYRNVIDPSGLIGLPRHNGPDTYERITTDSVAGIDINILPAWDQYKQIQTKREVIVAVIDTGIDISHPDLKNAIWTNTDEIPGDGIDNDGNGYVDDVNGWNFFHNNNQVYVGEEDDHGTHVAGTIAASRENGGIVGITDNSYVKIMPVKALGTASGTGKPEMIINAIKYAEANGASICNLSSGTLTSYPELNEVIKNSKMLFIVAAGNGDTNDIGYSLDVNPVYPAALPYDNIISVANLLFDGSLDESSNFGPVTVDIAAPGSFIVSTVPNGYGVMSGTSMAAPMVTGVAAMLYSSHPDWTILDVKNAILNSSRKLETLTGNIVTGGILDASAAMQYQK